MRIAPVGIVDGHDECTRSPSPIVPDDPRKVHSGLCQGQLLRRKGNVQARRYDFALVLPETNHELRRLVFVR